MSTTIDQRVVEMQFDNRHFENNVATTMSSLDKLKHSLDFSGATKGFDDIDNAARGVNMSGLGAAVETVRMKFSALQVMGITALSNITNTAVNAGKRIVSALTIDPIKTGLSEYETQINAVQTILANTESKGTTLDDVNKALDTLNEYADKTIYNFTEMTRNIGTFTAAGVDLDTSVNAIQGIANLAAVSGSTSQQASTAMYQLSQALSSGTVKLMDWNSVVNAGMGGQVFQDALKETARVHGVEIDEMIKENGSFRETLQEGWLTADILTETLSKFTMATEGLTEAEIEANREKLRTLGYTKEQIEGIFKLGNTATNAATKVKTFTQLWDTLKETAQSGWTQTWEIIFGDFEEAKGFFSDLYGTIAPILEASAKVRNELLQGWKDGGGRADLIESLYNIFEGIGSVVKPIKEAFSEIFPPATSEQLISITKAIKEFTAGLKLSDETSDKLKRTFKGLFAVLDIAWQAFSSAFKAVGSLFGSVVDLGGGILDITAKFGDWLVSLRDGIKQTGIFSNVLMGVVAVAKFVASAFKTMIGWVADIFGSFDGLFNGFGSAVSNTFESMSSSIQNCSLVKILQGAWKIIKTIVSAIIDIFGDLVKRVGELLGAGDFSGLLDIINSLIAGGLGVALIKFINGLKGSFDGIPGIFENISGLFGSVGGVFDSLSDAIKSFTAKTKVEVLTKIAVAIAILAASLLVLSLIDSDKLYDSLAAITMLFAGLMGAMSFMGKNAKSLGGLTSVGIAMVAVSAAILLLSFALKTISSLDMESMLTGLAGVAGLMLVVVLAVRSLSGSSMMKGAVQLVIFAAAIKILASACISLATLSWDELARGLTGVAVVMAAVAGFLRIAKLDGKAFSTGLGILAIAAALKIMASACSDFAKLSGDELVKGISAMGALLSEIAIFTMLTGDSKKVISVGIAMIAIAAAMKIFASAAQDMAALSWENLAKGLVGMAGALAAIVIAVRLLPTNMVSSGVGLVIIASALLILANALGRMGGMSWEGIAKSLVALGGSLLILAAGLKMMNGSISGSAALIVASVALSMLAPVLVKLGNMSWVAIAKGIIALAAAFAVIGIAAALLQPLLPAIFALAGAFALIGAGVALMGVGLFAIGVGLTAIATGIMAVVGALAGSTLTIIDLVAGIITGIAKGLAEGIIAICNVIIKGAPAIGEAIKVLILTLVPILVECLPVLVDAVLQFTIKLLASLAKATPQIVDSLIDILIGILAGLAQRLPELVNVVLDVILALIEGVIDALGNAKLTFSLEDIINLGALTGLMFLLASLAPLVPAAMAGVLGLGALMAELAIVLAAVGALAQIPGLTWLIDEGGELLEGIGSAIGKFVGGIVGGVAEGVTSALPGVATNLSEFMTNLKPFIDGAKSFDAKILDGVKAIAETILLLTGANIVDSIASWITGDNSLSKFGDQLAELGTDLNRFASNLGSFNDGNASTISCAAVAIKSLAETAKSLPNEGGWAAKICGENSIADFGSKLPDLGTNLRMFASNLGTFDEAKVTSITCAANAIKSMAAAAQDLPNEGGWAAKIFGENSIADFGAKLPELAVNLASFVNNLGTFGEEKIQTVKSAVGAMDALAGLADSDLKGAKKNLDGVGDKLGDFAKSLAAFCNSLPNESKVIVATEGLKNIASAINSISNTDQGALTDVTKALKTLGEDGLDSFVDAFSSSSAKTDITNATKGVVESAISGVESKENAFKAAFTKVATNAAVALKSSYQSFHDAGKYLVSGFVSGISENTFKAEAQAAAMAKAAAVAAEEALDINSPSKVFRAIGTAVPEGFAAGIDKFAGMVTTASTSMANGAVDVVGESIASLADLVSNDISSQPTIRPVLDLTDIKNGANSINSLLGDGSVGVLANVGAISSVMNAKAQNGGNDDVVSAIRDLRKDLASAKGDTYNFGDIAYNDDSEVQSAVQTLVRAVRIGKRV